MILQYCILLCNLDFDVRVGAINRGGQTRRWTVPDGRTADGLTTGIYDGIFIGGRFFVVPVAAAVRPQGAEGPGGRVLDDDPRAPDHGECQHFE